MKILGWGVKVLSCPFLHVRRLGLTLDCGTPVPLCIYSRFYFNSESKAAEGCRTPKIRFPLRPLGYEGQVAHQKSLKSKSIRR